MPPAQEAARLSTPSGLVYAGWCVLQDKCAAWINAVVQRKEVAVTLPAWEGEPSVTAHVMDLYAYLAPRADGTQGASRPLRHTQPVLQATKRRSVSPWA